MFQKIHVTLRSLCRGTRVIPVAVHINVDIFDG